MELTLNSAMILAALGGLVWLIRLEGRFINRDREYNLKFQYMENRIKRLEDDYGDVKSKHEELEKKIFQKLSEMSERLVRIESTVTGHDA